MPQMRLRLKYPRDLGREGIAEGISLKVTCPGIRADSSPPSIADKMLIGGEAVKKECVQVTCPACRQKVEAIARNGRVKGYCAVARRYVDFRV